jgi:hypothetical protein
MRLLLTVLLITQGFESPTTLGAQVAPAEDLRVTSAIFGTREGSADVTPIVQHLAKPGLLEFYAAPFWLEVDPAIGQNKTLVVFYEYRGARRVFTTSEPGAVSHAMLVQHADPAASGPSAGAAPATRAPAIESAFYGQGRSFVPATARVRALMQVDTEPFVVDDTVLELRPTAGANILTLTYTYEGRRYSLAAWRGQRVDAARLIRHAAISRAERVAPPEWVKDARPDPPRPPGSPGPGAGPAPRREIAIAELMKAVAELQAIPAAQRTTAVTRALTLTQSALANAQRNIGYPFPAPGSPAVEARGTSTTERVALATTALNRALNQLGAAGPGRGVVFLRRSLAEIQDALRALSP